MSPGHAKRLRRIERRGTGEIKAALQAGRISARICDTLLYLPPDQQAKELYRRLSARSEAERKSQLVAQTIRAYLDEHTGRRIDLEELRHTLREALWSR